MKREKSELFSMRLTEKEKHAIECLAFMYGANASVVLRMCLMSHIRNNFNVHGLNSFLSLYGKEIESDEFGLFDSEDDGFGGDEA